MFGRLYPSLLLLLLSGIAHSDVLFSTPPEGYMFPTSPPNLEGADASTTQGFATTDSTVTVNPTIVTSTDLDISPSSTFTTEPPIPAHTKTSTDSPVTQQNNVTSPPSTTEQTHATTVDPTHATTVDPTHATTVDPTHATTVDPTNATTVDPTNATTVFPTNATTVFPTNATTVFPTNATTVFPTNATTVFPTNATTASIPTTPVPTTAPLPNPSIGDYVVRADPGSQVCLKVKMGMQFRLKPGDALQSINIDPNVTSSNGSCGSNGTDATLILTSGQITVQFIFANQTNKFHLSSLNFTLDNGNGSIFSTANNNLSLWEASLGSSYMCRKEQTFNITDSLTLNTFELQVQPFGINDDQFSTAHECSVDDTSLLIPIIVGAALAGLIVIVVIAYMIGRRKTHVGYQTL